SDQTQEIVPEGTTGCQVKFVEAEVHKGRAAMPVVFAEAPPGLQTEAKKRMIEKITVAIGSRQGILPDVPLVQRCGIQSRHRGPAPQLSGSAPSNPRGVAAQRRMAQPRQARTPAEGMSESRTARPDGRAELARAIACRFGRRDASLHVRG